MLNVPERALIIKRKKFYELKSGIEGIEALMAFDSPFGESEEFVVYGPYFDLESLNAVADFLVKIGLEYWDDFFDLKEDRPGWCSLVVGPAEGEAGE
ncbi:hypothetical protein ACFQ4O_05515 [Methylopila musalis]|uniref:Uncharacterized protein n=1 Tax=Methylopila musalis TaxID=1134781 RepID=A0ABW3Z5B0_9HYPH